jgi:hypothetical protein
MQDFSKHFERFTSPHPSSSLFILPALHQGKNPNRDALRYLLTRVRIQINSIVILLLQTIHHKLVNLELRPRAIWLVDPLPVRLRIRRDVHISRAPSRAALCLPGLLRPRVLGAAAGVVPAVAAHIHLNSVGAPGTKLPALRHAQP